MTDEYKQTPNPYYNVLILKVVQLIESCISELFVHRLQLWMVEHLVCGSYEDRSKV